MALTIFLNKNACLLVFNHQLLNGYNWVIDRLPHQTKGYGVKSNNTQINIFTMSTWFLSDNSFMWCYEFNIIMVNIQML